MSEILTLARDYIEHMANPVYGLSVNEDYSIRFAVLLRSDEFEGRLRQEIRELTTEDTLTSYGWIWLLSWARSRRIDLPENLLVDLFGEWSSVFVRSSVLDIGTQNADYTHGQWKGSSIGEFPNQFIRRIMLQATESPEAPQVPISRKGLERAEVLREPEPVMSLAESTLIALLQLGTPLTLDAATVFLRDEWKGHDQLVRFFWAICDSLDPETRELWIERLDPPRNDAPRNTRQ